jgi:hypothetical protein
VIEMAEEEILVTRREYEEERKLVSQLEAQLIELQAKWLEKTKGLEIVPAEEYRREKREIELLERELRKLWSDWGWYMYQRRIALEEAERYRGTPELYRRATARAGRYLALIRETIRAIREMSRALASARAAFERKLVATPELASLRRMMEETQRKLEYERERLERKVIANKLIAMHKRWFYDSPRGAYHDISIEAVASMVIDSDEPKEKYEKTLKEFMEDKMYEKPGFERLTDLTEEVVGFEEKLVHPRKHPLRGPELHTLEWWHEIFKTAQLKITDFMRD